MKTTYFVLLIVFVGQLASAEHDLYDKSGLLKYMDNDKYKDLLDYYDTFRNSVKNESNRKSNTPLLSATLGLKQFAGQTPEEISRMFHYDEGLDLKHWDRSGMPRMKFNIRTQGSF